MFDVTRYNKNRLDHIFNSFQKAVENTGFKSAVAIIVKNGKVLLGKATNKDERLGKYCFPGGKIDRGENVYHAVKREAWEESGVICQIQEITVPITDNSLKGVAFIECEYVSGDIRENWEFEKDSLKWFDPNNLPKDILPLNKKLIKKYILK